MGLKKHICKNCKKEFENYFESASFCSKDCMYEYKRNNSKLANRICPVCGTKFMAHDSKSIHCSKECVWLSRMKRIKCVCEYCGIEFDRIESEVVKNKHHYCSDNCRLMAKSWNIEDINILSENYGKIKYKEMGNMFSRYRSPSEIKRKARLLGISKNQYWSDEEVKLLFELYSNKPLNEVSKIINKSKYSVLGKAHTYGLTSYFYNQRIYTKEEDEFIIANYKQMANSEIGKILGRTNAAIQQRCNVLGIIDKTERTDSYNNLTTYIRKRLKSWKQKVLKDTNYTCQISGKNNNEAKIIVHHILSFNLLIDELTDLVDYDFDKDFANYTKDELDYYFEQFLILQDYYGEYICITEDIHKQFHSIYGYGNNTRKQWDDFLGNKYVA